MGSRNLHENYPRGTTTLPIELGGNYMLKPGYFMPLHWHEQLEFHYIICGEGIISCNRVDYHFTAGDFIIINNYEIHSGFCSNPTLKSLVLVFDLRDFVSDCIDSSILFQALIQNDHIISTLMLSIFDEKEKCEFGYQSAIKGKLYELIVHLMRNYTIKITADINPVQKKRDLYLLSPVIHYIEQHYMDTSISVSDMAAMVNLSVGRFAHLFKITTGVSPKAYLNQHRLRKAYGLLIDGHMSVSQIASCVGFSDYNNFSSQFQKQYGELPSKIRSTALSMVSTK